MHTYSIQTKAEEFCDITSQVRTALKESGVKEGLCHVYCPHTTAGITINENTRSDVDTDILFAMGKVFADRVEFRHYEGNSAAHLKAGMTGSSVTVPVKDGVLQLGTWQGIFFCEFDGPRHRNFYVTVLGQ